MNRIRFVSCSSDGTVVFHASGHRYAYRWLDGLVVAHIRKIAIKRPGDALNVAKTHADEWQKDNGDWIET